MHCVFARLGAVVRVVLVLACVLGAVVQRVKEERREKRSENVNVWLGVTVCGLQNERQEKVSYLHWVGSYDGGFQ